MHQRHTCAASFSCKKIYLLNPNHAISYILSCNLTVGPCEQMTSQAPGAIGTLIISENTNKWTNERMDESMNQWINNVIKRWFHFSVFAENPSQIYQLLPSLCNQYDELYRVLISLLCRSQKKISLDTFPFDLNENLKKSKTYLFNLYNVH